MFLSFLKCVCAGVTKLKGFTACSSQEWDLVAVRQLYLLAEETENSHPKLLTPWWVASLYWVLVTLHWASSDAIPLGKERAGESGLPICSPFILPRGLVTLFRGDGSLNFLIDILRHHHAGVSSHLCMTLWGRKSTFPTCLCCRGCEWGHGYFSLGIVWVEWLLSKSFVLISCHFPGPLLESDLLLRLFLQPLLFLGCWLFSYKSGI